MTQNKTPAGKPMAKSAVYAELSTKTGLSKKEVASLFTALEAADQAAAQKKGVEVFNIPGLLKLKIKRTPASKGGKSVPNPFRPGEMMITKDKPAKNVVRRGP